MNALRRDQLDEIMANVGVNRRRLNGCARHRFTGGLAKREAFQAHIGERIACLDCGGDLDLPGISNYIAGYVAASGNPNDIWPGWA